MIGRASMRVMRWKSHSHDWCFDEGNAMKESQLELFSVDRHHLLRTNNYYPKSTPDVVNYDLFPCGQEHHEDHLLHHRRTDPRRGGLLN